MKICCFIFLALLLTWLPTNVISQESSCELSTRIIPEISRVRGLELKNKVPCLEKNKDQVLEYLEESLAKRFTEDKINYESLAFRALGLLPWKYDYKNELVKLYKDQIGGYYDPAKKYFVMASWLPLSSQENVAAHELTHALQDQHFNLDEMMDPRLTSDELLARSALAEGDATLAMLEFSEKGRKISSNDVSAFILSTVTGASLNKSLRNAPAAIQALLLFPYNSGLRYVADIKEKSSMKEENSANSLNNLFKNPPKTTREVIQEDSSAFQYSKITPNCEDLSKDLLSSSNENYQVAYQDRLGEFILNIALKNENKEKDSNFGWRDDQLCILSAKNKENIKEEILFWIISLESEKKSKILSETLQSYLKKLETPNLPYKVELNGKQVKLSISFQAS